MIRTYTTIVTLVLALFAIPASSHALTKAPVATSSVTNQSTSTATTTPITAPDTASSTPGHVKALISELDGFYESGGIEKEGEYNKLRKQLVETLTFAKNLEKLSERSGGFFAWITRWRERVLGNIIESRLLLFENRVERFQKRGTITADAADALLSSAQKTNESISKGS